MKTSICFSGPAWTWVNTAWLLLGNLLSSKWYHVLWDKEYASIIKWDNNDFILYISDQNTFISRQIDYFLAQDDYSISKNEKIYELKSVHNFKSCDCKYKNTFSFGASLKILGIDIQEWIDLINKTFWSKPTLDQNLIDLQKWYDYLESWIFNLSSNIWNPKEFKFWNQIIGEWAIASWLEWYSAYPMTPASSLIDVIVQDKKIIFFQWEDEIAVAMSMLWAKFAGKRAMCGTSGWWFALMSESISFSNQTEIWWVYILSQRDWPSTWTPTFTWQWDLKFSLTPTFWETSPIVIAPSSYKDWYNLIWKALNRSDIYQHPVIVLLDKQYSESYMSIDQSKFKAEPINRWELVIWTQWYKRYQFTDSGISPYTIPGTQDGEFIASSYEHDEYWATNEEPDMKKKMMQKRFQKMETFIQQQFNADFYWYEIINPDAKNFYITFGFNSYVLKDYIASHCEEWNDEAILNKKKIATPVARNDKYWIIIIKILQPLDPRLKIRFQDNQKNIQSLTFVEMNYTWQLQELITDQYWLNTKERENKIKHIRKYDLYPIFQEDLN